jgi:4-carboxymuconolactone decarboxylase
MPTEKPLQRVAPLDESEWGDDVKALLSHTWVAGVKPSLFRRTMARHGRIFRTWDPYGSSLLLDGALSARDRELLILRTVFHARGVFEWAYHVPLALRSGISEVEVRAIAEDDRSGWSPHDAALLAAVDDLLERYAVSDPVWDTLSQTYGDSQLIEVPLIVGQYMTNALITNTLRIEPPEDMPRLPAPQVREGG